jgi:predicted transcriptional regulator
MGKVLPNLKSQREAAHVELHELAKQANVSDALIQRLEVGGECAGDEADRIAAALSVSLATLGASDL